MTYTAIDCQGFAGGFTLGVAQAGFELVGKREMRGGFGARNCEVNRALLPGPWRTEAVDPSQWTVPAGGAHLVFGNPPCSGFSVLSNKNFRGVDSKINACMWAFVEYAAKVNPFVAAFESVPLAYSQGMPLMRALFARLRELSGEPWHLYHVLHNAYSVGGPSMRRRYFWVASRVPFGIEHEEIPEVLRLRTVIGDLETLPTQWESQPYNSGPLSGYAANQRREDGLVDGHIGIDNPHTRRARALLAHGDWRPGEYIQQVSRRHYETHGELPEGWAHVTEKLVKQDFFQGFNTPTMWRPDEPARVVTGSGMLNGFHWSAGRAFTHREVARIMGFPDDWLIEPLRGTPGLFLTWGKGITVDCGRWLARWIRHALDGSPGSDHGKRAGDESVIDVTNDWKLARCGSVNPVRKTETRRSTVTEVIEAEAAAKPGRPRPEETRQRDDAVYAALTEPKTVEALAAELGLTRNLTYLSLYRLRRDGRVVRNRVNGAHVWSVAAA